MIKRRRISFQRPTFDKATGGLIGGARGRTLDGLRDLDEKKTGGSEKETKKP